MSPGGDRDAGAAECGVTVADMLALDGVHAALRSLRLRRSSVACGTKE